MAKAAEGKKGKTGEDGGGGGDDDDDDDDEDSSSEESSDDDDDMIASADDELAELTAALRNSPELRAAAPMDEVEGEILALQYELLWQQQANRSVLAALLERVAAGAWG